MLRKNFSVTKKIIALLAIVATVLILALTIFHKTSPSTNSNTKSDGSKTVDTKASNESTSSTKTAQQQPQASTTTVSIVSARVDSQNIHVGTLVSGPTTGNCKLTAISDSGKIVTLGNSNIKEDVNSFSCGVYNFSPGLLSGESHWKLKLEVTTGANTSSAYYNLSL